MTTLEARREPGAQPLGSARSAPAVDHSLRRRLLVTALFVSLLGVMLRTGPHTLTNTFPNLGDSVFLAWSISWTGHVLATDPTHFFDANIYWPHALSLAYADNLVVALPIFATVRWLGGSWALALNVVFLGALLLSLAATYSLTRWLTGRTDASILAAIGFTFAAYTLAHVGHTQLMLLGFFPLAFLLLFRFLDQRSRSSAVLAGSMTVMMAAGALYYFAIYAVCVGVIVVGYIAAKRFRPGPGFVSGLGIAGAVSLLALPLLWGYYRLGLTRGLDASTGLKLGDLFTPAQGSMLYGGLNSWADGRALRWEHTMFPGFVTMALAAIGLVLLLASTVRRRKTTTVGASRRAADVPDRRLFVWLLVLAGGTAVLVAAGPSSHGITLPFTLLHDAVPGFGGIRAPARLAVPGLLALAVVAAWGFAGVTHRASPTVRVIAAVALGAFMLAEFAAPFTRTDLPADRSTLAVYHALTRKPYGAVVELPVMEIARQGGAGWAYVEAPRMLYSTIDWKPRFNGYSGDWPKAYQAQAAILNTFPSPESIATMQRLRIRYAVLHVGPYSGVAQYTESQADAIVQSLPPGATASRHGNAWLVDISKVH